MTYSSRRVLDVCRGSDVLATRAHLGENSFDAVLVDCAETRVGEAKVHPAAFALNPEAAALQIGQKPALGLVVGVGNVVPDHRGLTCDLTYPSHSPLQRLLR